MGRVKTAPQPVYAPILGMVMYYKTDTFVKINSVDDLDANYDAYIPIGAPEDASKLAITPIFTGPESDLRYCRSNIKIDYIDMEARKFPNPLSLDLPANLYYQQFQGKNVHCDILCGSGLITLVNLTYAFYYEDLQARGMRFHFQLTSKCIQPEFITFLDDGWDAYVDKVRGRALPGLYDDNVFHTS